MTPRSIRPANHRRPPRAAPQTRRLMNAEARATLEGEAFAVGWPVSKLEIEAKNGGLVLADGKKLIWDASYYYLVDIDPEHAAAELERRAAQLLTRAAVLRKVR